MRILSMEQCVIFPIAEMIFARTQLFLEKLRKQQHMQESLLGKNEVLSFNGEMILDAHHASFCI